MNEKQKISDDCLEAVAAGSAKEMKLSDIMKILEFLGIREEESTVAALVAQGGSALRNFAKTRCKNPKDADILPIF